MGSRADKRKKREQIANEKIFPNGKIYLPPNHTYKVCENCEHHSEFKISYSGWYDVYKSQCKLRCRKYFEVKKDACGDRVDIINGNPDVKENCSSLALLIINADSSGIYSR